MKYHIEVKLSPIENTDQPYAWAICLQTHENAFRYVAFGCSFSADQAFKNALRYYEKNFEQKV